MFAAMVNSPRQFIRENKKLRSALFGVVLGISRDMSVQFFFDAVQGLFALIVPVGSFILHLPSALKNKRDNAC